MDVAVGGWTGGFNEVLTSFAELEVSTSFLQETIVNSSTNRVNRNIFFINEVWGRKSTCRKTDWIKQLKLWFKSFHVNSYFWLFFRIIHCKDNYPDFDLYWKLPHHHMQTKKRITYTGLLDTYYPVKKTESPEATKLFKLLSNSF